jgi:hypothetical protein
MSIKILKCNDFSYKLSMINLIILCSSLKKSEYRVLSLVGCMISSAWKILEASEEVHCGHAGHVWLLLPLYTLLYALCLNLLVEKNYEARCQDIQNLTELLLTLMTDHWFERSKKFTVNLHITYDFIPYLHCLNFEGRISCK